MSTGAALRRRAGTWLFGLVLLGGCAQPGTPVSKPEAAKLDVGDSRISVACGYVEELRSGRSGQLGWIESVAESGARKLAAVYAHDHSGLYQGESVGGVLGDGISLLNGCRLPAARRILERALRG